MNRKHVQGTDGNWYWYNERTGRLFRSKDGQDEVFNFRYRNGTLQIVGTEQQPNPNLPGGGGAYPEPGSVMPPPPVPPGQDDDEEDEDDEPGYTREEARQDILDAIGDSLRGIFTDAEIEEIIQAIIEPVLMGEMSDQDILRLIRNTEAHKRHFPGFKERVENGHAGMTEAEYLQTKDDAQALFERYFGKKMTTEQFGQMWSGDTSVREFEYRLQKAKQIQDIGGAVKDFFQVEGGLSLDDEDIYEFLSENIATPEFDRLYEDAFYKRYLWNLGVNREVTDEMTASLRKRGVSVDQAIQRYQELAQSLPGIERLAAIDDGIQRSNENSYNSFGQAFRAFATLDPEAQLNISQAFAREIARFQGGGGPVYEGQRGSGLLARSQRQ